MTSSTPTRRCPSSGMQKQRGWDFFPKLHPLPKLLLVWGQAQNRWLLSPRSRDLQRRKGYSCKWGSHDKEPAPQCGIELSSLPVQGKGCSYHIYRVNQDAGPSREAPTVDLILAWSRSTPPLPARKTSHWETPWVFYPSERLLRTRVAAFCE